MKFVFAFGWIPVPVIYVPYLFGAAGFSPLVLILILSKYRDQHGYDVHELTHVEQSYKRLFLPFALLYLLSRKYRLTFELEAYQRQIDYLVKNGGDRIELTNWAAKSLAAPMYRLKLSVDEAKALFTP